MAGKKGLQILVSTFEKAMYMGQIYCNTRTALLFVKMRFDGKKYGSIRGGGGGGGLTKKCRTCMGWGCFRDPKHKSNMYTFVQQRGGCSYFIPNHKSINGTFVHTFHNKIIKKYEKMPNFHS